MRRAILLTAALLGLSAPGRPAQATTILRVPLDELARTAHVVVRGVVTSVQVATDRTGEMPVATVVTLSVREVLKGHPTGPTLTFRLFGGRTARWNLVLPGAPGFARDEEVVVFLESTAQGLKPAGLSEGKYRVVRDVAGANPRVVRSMTGASVLVRQGATVLEERAVSHADDAMDLDALRAAVRNAAPAAGGAR